MDEITYIQKQYAAAGILLDKQRAEYVAKMLHMTEAFAKAPPGEFGVYIFGCSTDLESNSIDTHVIAADLNASYYLGIIPHILQAFWESCPNEYKGAAKELIDVYSHLFRFTTSQNVSLN